MAPPPFLPTLAAAVVEDGTAETVVAARQAQLRKRNRMVDGYLDPWVVPACPTSPLRHLHLPAHFTGRSFEICAEQAGVLACGSERFVTGSSPVTDAVRLSVTAPASDECLEEGLAKLAGLLKR